MFNWDNKNTEFVYRIRIAILFLLFIPLLGSLIVVAYLSLLDPLVFPLSGYFYLLSYSFGLRLVYLLDDFILSTHLVVTPLTVFLVTVFVASSVLYVTWFWDLDIIRFLRRFKGFERYKDVKVFIRSLASKGSEGRAAIILGRTLFALALLFAIAFLLSKVLMYESEVGAILLLSMSLTGFLYAVNTLFVREHIASFVQRENGNIETRYDRILE